MSRIRGFDTGTLSGRQIIEMRERDLEKVAKEFIDNETFDPARCGIRGATVRGHDCSPLIKVAFADKNLPFDFAHITKEIGRGALREFMPAGERTVIIPAK